MRYIDADKLEYITWSLYNGYDMKGNTLFIEREIVSKQTVDAMPSADVVEVSQVNKFIQRLRDIPGAIYHSELSQVCKEFGFEYPGRRIDDGRKEDE